MGLCLSSISWNKVVCFSGDQGTLFVDGVKQQHVVNGIQLKERREAHKMAKTWSGLGNELFLLECAYLSQPH